MKTTDRSVAWFQSSAEMLAKAALNIIFPLTALAMLGLLIAGLYHVGNALLPSNYRSLHGHSIYLAVKGIEYIFLAPLGFFVVDGLLRYVTAITDAEKVRADGTRPSPLAVREQEIEARGRLLVSKVFTVSLLAAAVATALVGHVTSHALNIEHAVAGVIVLIALIGLLIVIQREAEACFVHLRPETGDSAKGQKPG